MPIARSYSNELHKETQNVGSGRSYWHPEVSDTPVRHTEYSMSSGAQDGISEDEGILQQDYDEVRRLPESRAELIARIKREQRPPWLQDVPEPTPDWHQPSVAAAPMSALLPALNFDGESGIRPKHDEEGLALASGIERPRSALHAGDFRQRRDLERPPDSPRPSERPQRGLWLSTSPTTPWYTPSIRQGTLETASDSDDVLNLSIKPMPASIRHRAASQSALSSNFILRPPTSPLAVQSNSTDFEATDESFRLRDHSQDKSYRRRTFSPSSLQISTSFSTVHSHALPSLRREGTFPYQAHQPRRSLSSFANSQSFSDSYTPSARSRRPSVSSESSPLHRAPMVGGYEESILRGRMSTLPSRPLDFVAQIGVLGKGTCKANLRCPPHVTVPFPAVFYDYSNPRDRRASLEAGPSPYVGLVDLENNSKPSPRDATTRIQRSPSPGSDADSNGDEVITRSNHERKSASRYRRRQSTKKAPKGGYRIPQQGQLQIVIKNPNKTAVKLFLVPYDLAGMEAGQKTFIRQRSYSAGPIIDMPLNARSNLGTDRPEAALCNSDDPKDRPVLRYLIHLHICCPSRGRFYLYRSIRVVFANRVPDGKEKLRNEIQLPEPRYSPYKPETPAPPVFEPRSSTHAVTSNPSHGSPSVTSNKESLPLANGGRTEDQPVSGLTTIPSATRFAFPRKTLEYGLSRISSVGSGSSRDLMSLDGHEQSLSPKSTTVDPANPGTSSMASSGLSKPGSGFGNPVPREMEQRTVAISLDGQISMSRSSRESLLALQFRDLAGHSDTQSES